MSKPLLTSRLIVVCIFLTLFLVGGTDSNHLLQAASSSQSDATSYSFAEQVVYLTNLERERNDLAPLQFSAELFHAAQNHAEAMASGDFFAHQDPTTGSRVGDRAGAAGFQWTAIGENIAAGNPTPATVVTAWMESPDHRQNILDVDYREIGVGYFLEAEDSFPTAAASYSHYWVQVFGTRQNVYPVVISNGAPSTETAAVSLYIYGTDWAQEMRLRNDQETFGDWRPFQNRLSWTLPETRELHSVTVELRNGDEVRTATDDIVFDLTASPTSTIHRTGLTVVSAQNLQVTPPVASEPASLRVVAQVSPATIIPGQESVVTLSFSGETLTSCAGILGTPVDVVFVFDISDSAGDGQPGSNWHSTTQFTKELFSSLSQPVYTDITQPPQESHLAIISSISGIAGPEAEVLLDLTADVQQALVFLDNIRPAGDSNIADGMRKAQELLSASDSSRRRIIFLMLHDNIPLSQAAAAAAQEVRNAGTQIFLVSNDLNITTENQITSALVQDLIGVPAHFVPNPQPGELRGVLVDASAGNRNASAAKMLVRSSYTPEAWVDIVAVDQGGVIRNGQVVWEIPQIDPGQTVQVDYRIQAQSGAPASSVQILTGITYLDCNGFLQGGGYLGGVSLDPAPMAGELLIGEIPTPTATSTRPPTVIIPTATQPPLPAAGTPAAAAPLYPTQSITQTLCPNNAVTFPLAFPIPSSPGRADVLLTFDVTTSNANTISRAASASTQIVSRLQALIPDLQIGVAIFGDYPIAGFGANTDTPYRLLQPITANFSAATNALSSLPSHQQNGNGAADAYTRALYEAAEDSSLGWRPDARHFVVIVGDSFGYDVDPGRDGQLNSADDLSLADVLEEIEDEGVTPLLLTPITDTIEIWSPLLTPIGGDAIFLAEPATIDSAIGDSIALAGAHISLLTIQSSPGYDQWLVADTITDLAIGNGVAQTLDAIVRVPADATAGLYTIELSAVGDGAIYARWVVTVDVPAACAAAAQGSAPGPTPFPCDDWLWIWLWPLLLCLLLLILWALARTLINRRRRLPPPQSWRCWLPCLLALLTLLLLGFFLGQRFARYICVELQNSETAAISGPSASVATSNLTTPGAVGADGSQQVLVIVASGYFDISSANNQIAFAEVSLSELDGALLAGYDTLVLSQVCNINQQPTTRLRDIVSWVEAGHKLIIYDSDECSQTVNYDWLPYPFVTDNPGALGSTQGQLAIVADDATIAMSPAHPAYIDPSLFAGIEIGDANVMVTQDLRWCGNMEAINANGTKGYAHGYTLLKNGLIVYNGLDTDNLGSSGMNQLWDQELAQPWDSVNGNPVGLPCQERVAGPVDMWGSFVILGIPVPLWMALLPLLFFWLLCYLGCRTRIKVKAVGPPFPQPPAERAYNRPPEPFGRWDGPPPVWNPEKTLIIGLGGSGRWALTLIKKNLLDAGAGSLSPKVRLLLLDSSEAEVIGQDETDVSFAGVRLSKDEILAVGDDLNELVRGMSKDAQQYPDMARWFPAAHYTRSRESELDIRKGTGGERPLGRAAIFTDLAETDASRVWSRLLDSVGAIQEGDEARVVIVSSLAGGFGGAVLADVAYLARHAARQVGARFASVEAYLATQHTFDAVVSISRRRDLAANTFAALEELRRFQLQGTSFPYGIRYSSRYPGDPVWDGRMDRPLLDDLYLFDGFRPDRPLLRELPVDGVLATIADTVTLHLDTASRKGTSSLWAYRRQIQGESSNQQRRTGRAMVSSGGVFAYRLPVYDLGQALNVRWAKHLLGYLLLGEAGGTLRIDPGLNRESTYGGMSGESGGMSVQLLAREFVKGMAGLSIPPHTVILLGQLLDLQVSPEDWAAWSDEEVRLENNQREESLYRVYLMEALGKLLNGFADDVLVARPGKLGIGLRWLERVEAEWGEVEGNLSVLPGRIGGKISIDTEVWQAIVRSYRQVTVAARTHLMETVRQISQELGEDKSSTNWRTATTTPTGLYDLLLAKEHLLDKQRAELSRVVTRRYFISDGLLDRWYDEYLADQVTPHVGRLFWQSTSDGSRVELAFSGLGKSVGLHTDGPNALAQALLDVAGFLSRAIWDEETLSTYLAETDLQRERINVTADEMWAASAPLLDFDRGEAMELQALAVLGVNESVHDTHALQDRLAIKLPTIQQMRKLEITDPYTMLLARFYDVIPCEATNPYRKGEPIYRGETGLSDSAQGGITSERAVFPAERNALALARRLPELNQTPRFFHPLFVAALDDLTKAELFVKALAAGLIRMEVQGDRDVLVARGLEGTHDLIRPEDRGFQRLSVELIAMLNFVSAPNRVLADISAALDNLPDIGEKWKAYRRNELSNLVRSTGEGARDLAALVDLVLYDLIQRTG